MPIVLEIASSEKHILIWRNQERYHLSENAFGSVRFGNRISLRKPKEFDYSYLRDMFPAKEIFPNKEAFSMKETEFELFPKRDFVTNRFKMGFQTRKK